ncbi:BQ5605_C019g08861 [Microbotryum silenes-dioicae]|uniref:BQ5605_C019g08861 protein n=1 Tax=Microbotryum silenes-dioicae TaxID=796604 RepID=A0A2X0MQT0_9BASI|nr:BQ5605_C019g08861 [Microbotryum silenes-dioicae]
MSALIKDKLKLLKTAVQAKDWTNVEKHASIVLSFEPSNYNARVFLALACTNLERFDQAQEEYQKAIELAPSQFLARQGLASLYEKQQRWTDYAAALDQLVQQAQEAQDGPKCAESLAKLIQVRRTHGTTAELAQVLSLLLPSSPLYPILQTLPPPQPTNPTATTYHSIQMALFSPLPTLLELLSLTEAQETNLIESEIKKRRQRLGGPSLSASETRKLVEREYMLSSKLPDLYKVILEDPDASEREELRRQVEGKLLRHWQTLLFALPSSFDEASLDLSISKLGETGKGKVSDVAGRKEEDDRVKNSVRWEIEQLTKGMVLIEVEDELAWKVQLDWGDRFGNWEEIDWRLLNKFKDKFPDTGLAAVISVAHRYHLAHLEASTIPDDLDKNDEDKIVAPSAEESAEVAESGLEKSNDLMLAHLLLIRYFSDQEDYATVVSLGEGGLHLLRKREAEIGRALPSSRTTLETHLAIALVHHSSPTHHVKALRLLDSLLGRAKQNGAVVLSDLLVAKALVYQSSEKWLEAVDLWNQVLSFSTLTENVRITAQSERGWSLFNAKQFDAARVGLHDAVIALEARYQLRLEQQRRNETARSKAGVEKPPGLEEGESSREAEERAKALWRLGECDWVLSEEDESLTLRAFQAYLDSIKACPDFAPTWTSLGIYYRSIEPPDWSRSLKCFQRAFELDQSQEVAARYMAEEFAEIGDWGLVEKVARRVVEAAAAKAAVGVSTAKKLAWAYKAIGGSEMNSQKYPQAIVAFQTALRGEPEDVHTWLRLGAAYRGSGKHVAALKVFSKVLSIDSDNWFAKFSIGGVQREMGLFEPALTTFKDLLVERPDELGVQVVYAETLLSAGMEQLRTGFLSRAEESFVETLEQAIRVIETGGAKRVAWKLAGEASSNLVKISECAHFERSKGLAIQLVKLAGEMDVDTKVDGIDIVTVAAFLDVAQSSESPILFAGVAVLAHKARVVLDTHNEAAIGSAWADLGTSVANLRPYLSKLSPRFTPETALHQAIRALKFGLHHEPFNSSFWNALGVLTFDISGRLAQHCFIRSIEHNSQNAIAWTNLGLFYLVYNDDDLANQAFLKAQVIDPEWAAAWIGQATLADMAGHALEASVLLEHAFTLGADTSEADIAFASHALEKYRRSTSVDPDLVADRFDPARPDAAKNLTAPLFAITRYLTRRPNDVSALHVNALILEHLGDRKAASESFERAAALLEELYEEDESASVEGRFIIAQTNLGRVRLASENYEDALEAFDAALSLIDLEARPTEKDALTQDQAVILFSHCKLGSALAHYFLEETSMAEQTLEEANDDLDSYKNDRTVHLAAALARIYFAGGDETRALGALLDSPDITKSSVPLFIKLTLEALSIITRTPALDEMLSRMKRSDPIIKYSPASTKLTALGRLIQGDVHGAVRLTSRVLHVAPWTRPNRARLARLLTDFPTALSDPKHSTTVPSPTIAIPVVLRLLPPIPPTAQVEGIRALQSLGMSGLAFALNEDVDKASRGVEKALHFGPWLVQMQRAIRTVIKFSARAVESR